MRQVLCQLLPSCDRTSFSARRGPHAVALIASRASLLRRREVRELRRAPSSGEAGVKPWILTPGPVSSVASFTAHSIQC